MTHMILIAELSTNHGGDVDLACEMVRQAAEAGADYAKIQSYSLSRLNPADPQRAWLERAHLDEAAHMRIFQACVAARIKPLSTPFDADSLTMLRRVGLKRFKIASSESGHDWWRPLLNEQWFISYPWGDQDGAHVPPCRDNYRRLTAIPLYPTPLEAVGRATLLDGWSDHTQGLVACQRAIVLGATVLEVHMHDADKRGRVTSWDKSPEQIRELRAFADAVQTMTTGVSTVFRTRWSA